MTVEFIHLRVHSEYSLTDGIVRIKPLMSRLKNLAMPAVAITEQSNLFSIVKFYKAAHSAGIKAIIGCDIRLVNENDPQHPFRLTLLCMNNTGYRNLLRLVSRSYVEGQQQGIPIVHRDWIDKNTSEGLIALSGGFEGDVGKALLAGETLEAKKHLNFWQNLFPDRYYIEVQRLGRKNENAYTEAVITLAIEMHLPIVATNDVCFVDKEDFMAHEARVCIHDSVVLNDSRREQKYTEQQYLRDSQEMKTLFADLPESLSNTVEIAKRCNVTIELGKAYLPDFPIPNSYTIEGYLAEEASKGLSERLSVIYSEDKLTDEIKQQYTERLNIELKVINDMGFPGYFLIVSDFIRWAKQNDIPVGPGRGSGAGSLVAYALKITDLDPLEYALLFERFLNPERVSMPDFDIDFCMEGRDRVIEYVADKYGRESVSQIITYGTMAAKAVVRDVGRVLGHPYGFVDKIAKLIPFELGITLDKALEQEDELQDRYNQEEEVKHLIDLARKLEGITRNAGKHAGGVVIAPSLLTDFAALYCEEGGANLITQFDKDDVEAVGLVKFDFLGLRTLTIIDWALQTINQTRRQHDQKEIKIDFIPLDDAAVFELLQSCQTTAIFQLESRGMKDLIKRLKPDSFEDIIALVALFRPGPLQSGMVDDFVDRKNGRAEVIYSHPDLEPILKPTYGVILYQEQVMQIAQELAGYTLGGADLLRRAMGKKKAEEMAKQRTFFVTGATERGIEKKTATYIFDLMEKFAGYGFNKSHSAAYALIAYQTAWLKTHYPAAYMAAVLSADMDNTTKIVGLVEDVKNIGLTIIPPHINTSQYKFTVNEKNEIIFGLGAIKGVGEGAIESIVENRQQGKYDSLFDFCYRVDSRKVNRRVLEALIKAGAMDHFDVNRATLSHSIEKALKGAERRKADLQSGQADLFSDLESSNVTDQYVLAKPWKPNVLLSGEHDTLGFYLSGHPLDTYQKEFSHFISERIADLTPSSKKVIVAGLITDVRKILTKRQKRMAIVTIDDGGAKISIAVFSEQFSQYRQYLEKNEILIVKGEVSHDDFTGGIRMSCESLWDIVAARELFAKFLKINLSHDICGQEMLEEIKRLFYAHSAKTGTCPMRFMYQIDGQSCVLSTGNQWLVQPNDELLEQLRQIAGDENVQLVY